MIEHVFSEDVINRKNKSLQIVNLPADISIKKIDIKSVHDHYDIRKIESDNLDLVNPENLVMTENIAEKIEEDIELIEEKSEISFGSTKDTNHLKKLHQKTSQKLRSNQPIIIIKPEESESTENVNLISEKKEESVLQNEKEEDLYVNLKEPEDSKNKQTAEKILEIDMEATGLAYMNPENKGSKEILTQEEIDSFNSKFDINIFKKDQNLIGLDSIQNTNRQETTEKNPIIFKKPKKYVKIDKLSPNKLKSFVTKTSQEFDELIASPIGTPPEINYDEAIEKFQIVEKSEEIIRNPNQKPRLIIKRYGNIQQSPRINEKLNKKLVDDGNFLTKDVQKTYKSQEIDHNYKKFNTELLVEDQTENPLDLDSSFIREDLTSLDSEGTNILTEESFKISEENHPETKLNQKFIVKRPTKPTISDIGIFKNSQDSFTSDPNYKSDSNFLTSQLNTDFDPSYTPLFSLKRLPTIKISAEAEAQTRENIQQEKTKLLRENLILDQFSKVEVRSERPMSYVNLFRFFEDMMDNKHKTDLKDLQDRRRPRSMTEFLMEYLNRRFGIESLAMKTLGQLLPALKSLANEGHPYARLFARLLQIFHPDPVPYNLSLYLVKARIEFHHYIEKAEKIKEALSLKPNKESSNKTHGKAAYEHAGTGGEAMIVDIIDHIYMLFEEDPESGTLMIEKICPDKVDFNDFVAFLIANKMRKKGKKPEDIFLQLDKDHGGSLDAVEFIQGAKGDLEV